MVRSASWRTVIPYVYDGQHISLELRSVTNESQATSDVYRRIMHGVAIDEVLAEETVWGTSRALSDHLGTIHDGWSTLPPARARTTSTPLRSHPEHRRRRSFTRHASIRLHWPRDRRRHWHHRPLDVLSSQVLQSKYRQIREPRPDRLPGWRCEFVSVCGEWCYGATDPSGQSIVGKTGKAMVKKV